MTQEEKAIEIPFGAEDSELIKWEYTIPEGMEAEIKDGKVIIKKVESEDERIRKWLLDYAIEMIAGLESDISRSTYDGIKGHDPEAEAELAKWQKARAYLEKQKENPKSADSIPSDCASDAKCEDRDSNYGVFPEDVIVVARACEKLETHGYPELAYALKNVNLYTKEQKPAEWSEEDEKMRSAILQDLANIKAAYPKINIQDEFDWLKSLRPQQRQEWSEEDEKDMAHIIRILDDCYAYGKHDLSKTDHENLVNKLKSLRPSWKPNDEDEERLINTSISFLKDFADKGYENAVECIDWLKSKLNGNTGK